MLVLSRKVEESVSITVPPSTQATVIDVKVLTIKPRQIQLGFEAPRSVSISRSELPPERRITNQTG